MPNGIFADTVEQAWNNRSSFDAAREKEMQANMPAPPPVAEQVVTPAVPAATPQPAAQPENSNLLFPETSATQVVNQGAGKKMTAQEYKTGVIDYLMTKKGYSYEDAERLMAPNISAYAQREALENQKKADALASQLDLLPIDSPAYRAGAFQLAKLDPARGQLYLKDGVSRKDLWHRQNQLSDREEARQWQMAMRGGLVGGGGRGRSGGGGGRRGGSDTYDPITGLSGKETKAALGRIKAARGIYKPIIEGLEKRAADGDRSVLDQLRWYKEQEKALALNEARLQGIPMYEGVTAAGGANPAAAQGESPLISGLKNVYGDYGVNYEGNLPEDVMQYVSQNTRLNPQQIQSVGKAYYNQTAKENQADAEQFEGVSNNTALQLHAQAQAEAKRLGFGVSDITGEITGATEEFKRKYPNEKYAPGGAQYFTDLLEGYGDLE